MDLSVSELPEHGAAVVRLPSGVLDISNSKSFTKNIGPVLSNHATVLLDLSDIEFVDSAGLGSLLSCLRTVNAKEGDLRLFGMREPVQAMFELVRMHRLFAIYQSQEEATATLGTQPE